jgi:uncharacterized protein (DUF58 family)
MPLVPDARPLITGDFLARLERLDLVSRKILTGKMRGERRSRRRGRGVEFADYRNYVTGDDLRFIDWNLYARLDRLFLRLFLEDEDLWLDILIDTSASTSFGEPPKLLRIKQLAAAIGYVGLVNQHRVAIHTMTDRLASQTGPMRGKTSARRMLGFLDALEADGSTDLQGAAKRFALTRRGRGVVVVISDFLDKRGYEPGLRFLAHPRDDLFVIQLLSPQEIDPDFKGDLKLTDVEDNTTAEVTISGPLVQRYKQQLEAYRTGLKQYVAARGGSYLFASTQTPFDKLVLEHLRERRLVG